MCKHFIPLAATAIVGPLTATLLGILAVLIMLLAYGVQLWKTYKGKSEPHPIAWFGFGFLTGIGFLVQLESNAGPGSWVMGFTAFFCFLVAGMSQYKKRWKISDFDGWDWAALVLGIGLFVLYLVSRNLSWGKFVSAALATAADLVLYAPIFKKAWKLPWKENATAYGLNSIKFIPSIFAMSAFSIETCLYPVAMIVANAIVVIYLLFRRRALEEKRIQSED